MQLSLLHEVGADDIIVPANFWTDFLRADLHNTSSAARWAVVDALRDAGVGLPDRDVRELTPGDETGWRTVFIRR